MIKPDWKSKAQQGCVYNCCCMQGMDNWKKVKIRVFHWHILSNMIKC